MTPLRIRRLVEERIGLDPDSLGATAFDTTVRTAGKSFANLEEYATVLESHHDEFDKLIERLVVPETWFFRGGLLFETLAKHVAKLAGKKIVRILCLPCSTGEEPYSLAMALLEAGVPTSSWEIQGVDISTGAIASAMRGMYRKFSFRELPAHLRAKYFRHHDGGWTLAESVRKSVRFQTGNLFEFQGSNYDIILCRNLLIYLTAEGRRNAIDQLLGMLAPEGIFGVGHAEPSALTGRGLVPLDPHELFLFVRSAERIVAPTVTRTYVPELPSPAFIPSPVKEVVPNCRTAVPSIENTRNLADSGRLAEALAECQRVIADTPSAEAYALLGLIHQALGDDRNANDSFRKALYLDPGNATAKAMARIAGGAA